MKKNLRNQITIYTFTALQRRYCLRHKDLAFLLNIRLKLLSKSFKLIDYRAGPFEPGYILYPIPVKLRNAIPI